MINVIISKDSLQIHQYLHLLMIKNQITTVEIVNVDYLINSDLEAQINQISLFNKTKLFIIHNASFLTSAEEFKLHKRIFNVFNEFETSDILIYFVVESRLLTNSEFQKFTKQWHVVTLKEIDNNEKVKIINELLKQHELFLSKDVYNYLLQNLDCCYGNIHNEISKLANLMISKPNKQEMMEIICNYNKENIFHLFEALLNKNHERIWQIYNDLMNHHEDEISLINTIASQTHNLYYVLKLLKQHCAINTISQLTGVSIYYINLYKNKFINYNIDNINQFLLGLYKLEVDIKLSKIDKSIGFKQFLLQISH